jgi:hypothetical protein
MDTECKGDRVCDAGQCVSPPSAAAPLVEQPYGSEVPTVAPAPAPPVEEKPIKQDTTRRSKPLMVGGIVTTAMTPVALIVAYIFALEKTLCDVDNSNGTYSGSGTYTYPHNDCTKYETPMYVSLAAAAGFVAVGVPMIVIGAKSVPVNPSATQEAAIAPWVTPTAAGISLRLKM